MQCFDAALFFISSLQFQHNTAQFAHRNTSYHIYTCLDNLSMSVKAWAGELALSQACFSSWKLKERHDE